MLCKLCLNTTQCLALTLYSVKSAPYTSPYKPAENAVTNSNNALLAVLHSHCTHVDTSYVYSYYIWFRDILRMIFRQPSVNAEFVDVDFNPQFTGMFRRLFPVGTHVPAQYKENWKDGWVITTNADGSEVSHSTCCSQVTCFGASLLCAVITIFVRTVLYVQYVHSEA
jgi:hypothetical protein